MSYAIIRGEEMKTARIFKNGRSQAVRLPKDFQFQDDQVFIQKHGEAVILVPHGRWKRSGPRAGERNSLMYLLDTNICIYAIKQKHEKLLDLIKEKSGEGLFISSLTVAELEFGVQNSQRVDRNRIAMIKFLSYFNILNFDGKERPNYRPD